MKTCRYFNLLEDLKQCTELIYGDINVFRELSYREKNSVVKILEIFQETLENVGDVEDFIENLISNSDPVLF